MAWSGKGKDPAVSPGLSSVQQHLFIEHLLCGWVGVVGEGPLWLGLGSCQAHPMLLLPRAAVDVIGQLGTTPAMGTCLSGKEAGRLPAPAGVLVLG